MALAATATARSDTARDHRYRRDHGAWFLVLPALVPILVLSVGPLLYGIALSLTDAQSGRTQATTWTGTLNFRDLLHDTLFWDSFRIGLVWAFGVTVPQFVLALGLALLLNQNLRLRWLARALAIIPWAMPEVVVGIMWRLVYHPDAGVLNETIRDLGLGDGRDWLTGLATALPAVIVVGVWSGMPQTTVALLAGLQNTPRSSMRPRRSTARVPGAGSVPSPGPRCGPSRSRSRPCSSSGTSTPSPWSMSSPAAVPAAAPAFPCCSPTKRPSATASSAMPRRWAASWWR